jgi:cyanate permease
MGNAAGGHAPSTLRHPRLLLLAAVLLVAANLRSTITGAGPLLTQISA